MCDACWDEAGAPTVQPAGLGMFLTLHDALYEDHPTGGPLHVELDDWNIDGDRTFAPYYRPTDGPELHDICDALAALLRSWTDDERYAALAYADRILPRPTEGTS